MRLRSIRAGKAALAALIVLTSVIPVLFVRLNEPAESLVTYKVLAKTGSLIGTMLILWQLLLGFRGAVSKLLQDLPWIVGLHRKLGIGGSLLIVLHPVFISLYYAEKHGADLFGAGLTPAFNRFVVLGTLAFLLLALLVLTSAVVRETLSFRSWKGVHLAGYLLPPLVLVHSFAIGQTVRETGLRYFWIGLAVVFTVLYLYRLLFAAGVFSVRYRVSANTTVAEDTSEITLTPEGKGLKPAIGQFVYVSRGLLYAAHPFTVSRYDARSGELSITVKELGKTSGMLREYRPGDHLHVDGSYGVFARAIVEEKRPVVMIAGGIGITPFRRLVRGLEKQKSRESYLFYGNEYESDIAFRKEIDSLRHVKAVHVVRHEEVSGAEKGFVTLDVIKKHLSGTLSDYDYLLCGPPAMVEKLSGALSAEGIDSDRIHYELFSF